MAEESQTSANAESNAQPPPPIPATVAAGPAPWISLTPEEQIERLRLVIRGQDRQLAELRKVVFPMLRHEHGADGKLVTPLVFGGGHAPDAAEPDPGKVWL